MYTKKQKSNNNTKKWSNKKSHFYAKWIVFIEKKPKEFSGLKNQITLVEVMKISQKQKVPMDHFSKVLEI